MSLLIEKLKENSSIIKYLVFGACTTLINIVSYYLSSEIFNISNIISTVIAWVLAVTFAFISNKLYVFNSKSWNKDATREVIQFFAFRIIVGAVEVAIMFVMVDILKFNGIIMKVITNIIAIVLNYIASKFVVFSNDKWGVNS